MRTTLFSFAALILVGVLASSASANLLTDPGFEANQPMGALNTTLNNFTLYQNLWAAENGNVFGPVGAVNPATGNYQAEVFGPGTGVASQMGQIVDVSAFAGIIDANQALISAGAVVNSDTSGAIGGVYVNYYTAANLGSFIGSNNNLLNTLDNLPSTWEPVGFNATIPAGTRWIVFQAAFDSNSISNSAGIVTGGFVDDTYVDIRAVPEPASIGVIGAAMIGLLMRRRSRR